MFARVVDINDGYATIVFFQPEDEEPDPNYESEHQVEIVAATWMHEGLSLACSFAPAYPGESETNEDGV